MATSPQHRQNDVILEIEQISRISPISTTKKLVLRESPLIGENGLIRIGIAKCRKFVCGEISRSRLAEQRRSSGSHREKQYADKETLVAFVTKEHVIL